MNCQKCNFGICRSCLVYVGKPDELPSDDTNEADANADTTVVQNNDGDEEEDEQTSSNPGDPVDVQEEEEFQHNPLQQGVSESTGIELKEREKTPKS
ncbi:hypothetical protein TrST_g4407 [Triparma strigata]|uniref:Uncharacterized protein n=1 Tax=Triparma strigata TaxID=1606541 RepID=A0A9W7AF14_9STRA|nr:hypothetical protein TrST_g4407 [Triparma strigata]